MKKMKFLVSQLYMLALLALPFISSSCSDDDDPKVEMYRHRDIIVCCGRGAWEVPMQEDAGRIKELLEYKNVPAWVDFWGTDVAHDWPWWRKQLPYYLNYVC